MSPHILLLGGGYTLTYVAQKLDPAIFIITSRSAETVKKFTSFGWNAAQVETRDESQCKAIFEQYPEIDQVVDSIPPLIEDKGEAPEVAIRGVRNTSAQFKEKPNLRVIYLSTTGVFGVDDGSWVDESTVVNPGNLRSRARFQSEEHYRKFVNELCVLRLPAIYGPGRGIGHSLVQGRYRLISRGERWSNRIQVEDLRDIIIAALKTEKLPRVLAVSDDKPSTALEVVEYYCKTFKLAFPNSITLEEASALGLHTMLSNQRIKNDLMKTSLGITLRYPSYVQGAFSEFKGSV